MKDKSVTAVAFDNYRTKREKINSELERIASHWGAYTKGRLVGYDDLRKDLEEEFRRSIAAGLRREYPWTLAELTDAFLRAVARSRHAPPCWTVRLDVAEACLEGCEEIRQLTDDIQHQAH